ncbi:GAF and ANTAR domain-containing protein [Streptomyces sp. 71268]|uniref:GAF and ANTAR domain-containing protein n=1 Tax=Streptomyces sp. 71268 TaxID=3002640 RepID=UPI0023F7415D|nr:GAF and ANTAR domain-containing protein [Streptomyces sp. 71268]WEV24268.1 GAF and ANTAR domain-containing protein [Streptomyces sp. 71268]
MASDDDPHVTDLLLETDSLEGFLDTLADHALARTPAADGCGITLSREGRFLTVASAGRSARDLDEKQYGLDDGPCLQALRNGEEFMIADMLGEQRWDPYPAHAVARGTRSSLSLPIAAHTHTAGALNLYSPKPDGFAETDLTGLRLIAAQATGAIALAQRIADAQRFANDLETAMRSRSIIDQAIGIIMGQQRCDAEKAFGILRGASQNRNIKLRDLCRDLVTSVGGRPPQDGGLRPRP